MRCSLDTARFLLLILRACRSCLARPPAGVSAQAPPASKSPSSRPSVRRARTSSGCRRPQALVNKMLDMAKVTPPDFLMDLGSGDGRTVITAAKRGVKRHGHRIQPRHGGAVEAERRGRRRQRQGHVRQGGHLRDAIFQRPRSSRCSSCPTSISGCARSCSTWRQGHDVVSNSFTDGSLGAGRDRDGLRGLRQLVHGASLDRAGEGRRHVADARRAISP